MTYNEQQAYDELCYYTLAHGDPSFIHQHAVDAFGAQTITENDKPIRLTFSLIGLYLYVEKQFTGKQVQLAHMKIAKHKQIWPTFSLPQIRGTITSTDVLAAPSGHERDQRLTDGVPPSGRRMPIISRLLLSYSMRTKLSDQTNGLKVLR
jgi:hypothetical protein